MIPPTSHSPRFCFLRGSPTERPSGFDLGHVRVTLGGALATSEGRTPDQAFMIYVTATELCDQARQLLVDRLEAAEVIGVDSSFRLSFRRRSRSELELDVGGQRLGCTSPIELARAVASGVQALLDESPLDSVDPVHGDLGSALDELRVAIERAPPEPEKRPRRRGSR